MTSPSDAAPSGKQPEDPAAERGLAAAGLADEADDLSRVDVERDAVDGAHGAARRPVVDAQSAPTRRRRTRSRGVRPRRGGRPGGRSDVDLRTPRAQHRVERLVEPLAEERQTR